MKLQQCSFKLMVEQAGTIGVEEDSKARGIIDFVAHC